jgi:hypothetical protein
MNECGQREQEEKEPAPDRQRLERGRGEKSLVETNGGITG